MLSGICAVRPSTILHHGRRAPNAILVGSDVAALSFSYPSIRIACPSSRPVFRRSVTWASPRHEKTSVLQRAVTIGRRRPIASLMFFSSPRLFIAPRRLLSSLPSSASSPLSPILSSLPGVVAAGVVMEAGFRLADVLGSWLLAAQGLGSKEAKSPISGVPVAILLGLALNNFLRLPSSLAPGLKLCTTTLLRAGIICIGAKLSLFDVAKLGAAGVPVVVSSLSAGLLFVPWFAKKMNLSLRLGSLIAVGTSICGVTAITALAPAIRASAQEVAFAVANVVAFGLMGMLCYPYIAHAVFPSSEQVGLFLGTAVHDTSQVMGCALTYRELYDDEVALKVAAVTKMTRNLFLAAVIPALTWQHAAALSPSSGTSLQRPPMNFKTMFPLFVLGFVGAALGRTMGDASIKNSADNKAFGLVGAEDWERVCSFISDTVGGHYLLGTAMAAVGLSTSTSVLRGVGPKPFIVGLAGAAVVGGTGFVSSLLLGKFLSFEKEKHEADEDKGSGTL